MMGLFEEEDVIMRYTSEEAEADGVLFDVTRLNPAWKNGLFNFVTVRLLENGYFTEDGDEISIPNLVDLLNQALHIVKKSGRQDWFYSGMIELPSGNKQKIFICQNETGRFTLMLPGEY